MVNRAETELSMSRIRSVWNSKYLVETWRMSSAVRSATGHALRRI